MRAKNKRSIPFSSHRSLEHEFWYREILRYQKQGYVNESFFHSIQVVFEWYENFHKKAFYQATKAMFDRFLAALSVVLLIPVVSIVAILIKLESPGPIFYSQLRIGHMGNVFRIYKFRTMYLGAEARRPKSKPIEKIYNDPRVTVVGRILRKYKIDEFPQIFNVLLGNMSPVGPRPLPIEESATIADEFLIRFSVKPGLTGLWQVQNTNAISNDPDFKLSLDAQYARECGFWLDLKLIVLTIPVLLRGEKLLVEEESVQDPHRKKSA